MRFLRRWQPSSSNIGISTSLMASATLLLSAITVLGGVVFASLLALMKMSKVALRWLSTIYIEVIRGTPMLLQLYFFYFDCPC